MILGGQSIPEKVHSDLVHPRDKTKIVLKSLDQMLFKNSLCNTLALICAKQPLPNVYYRQVLAWPPSFTFGQVGSFKKNNILAGIPKKCVSLKI